MCPTDTTPDPRDMERMPESQEIPQAVPGASAAHDEARRPPDIARRPPLPERPEIMAADIEDEEDDPVVESGPGVVDREGRAG
ncbi:MAG TPA: hypothetical protein VFE82_14590 [Ramlibacter sp.]|jgi:hypothetical protein|uniref:hypothetical protein n=1 Tax=Ramlibacter sp. TaxID=1917967 RepID=UPI002D506500|nr:hypothetical protein [Ramlibacter sp.]HZY19698.1 hypothetical protein [Ramlibacter sp.]